MKKFVIILLALMLAMTSVASAAGLPKKIEVQLPAKAGGGTDVAGRQLTDWISKNGGTTMTIKNNTDGNGVVAYETIRTAKKDGSKILFFHTTMCIKYATGAYNHSPADEFKVAGVGLPTEKGGYVLVVPTASGITNLDEFIAAANKATSDGADLRIGIETKGSSHVMSGMMAKELGISLRYTDAGSDTDKLTGLVGGSIDCALVNANQARQYVEAEKVNAIACFSATDEGARNSVLPDVPSFSELGHKLIFGTYFYVLLPETASDETAEALHDVFAAAATDPEVKEILEKSGFGMEFVPYAEGAELLKAQQNSVVEICKEMGIDQ
ncbi:MAG: tripartite tricarboxylate transporter substrate binding protein [Clostridia bacterium]|nr:tripartite tricarboxylate transporter substrate binding protein [Clostridia bacterium]